MEPDLDGFREASITLRAAMGREVVFLTPTETVWPEGTPLDPQTGEPYDPVIQPLASGWASAAVPDALVVVPGGSVRVDTVTNQPIGEIEAGQAVVIIAAASYAIPQVEAATRVVLFDGTYDITEADPDSVGGEEPDRVILHLRQRDRGTTP